MLSENLITFLPFTTIRAFCVILLLPLPREAFPMGHKVIFALLLGSVAAAPAGQVVAGTPSLLSLPTEIMVGGLIGLPIAVLFTLTGVFAELFDSQRGQTFGTFFDPNSGTPASQSALVMRSYLFATLLLFGGGEVLYVHYVESFDLFPVGTSFIERFIAGDNLLLLFVHKQLGIMLTVFVPMASLLLLVDLCFAFAAKALPKVPVYHESFLVKTFVGFFVMLLFSRSDFLRTLLVELSRPVYIQLS